MKKTCGLLFGLLLSSSLVAQPASNAPPIQTPGPAALTTNPVAGPDSSVTNQIPDKAAGKKSRKKAPAKPRKKTAAAELKTVPLAPGPAVVEANNVNVRG